MGIWTALHNAWNGNNNPYTGTGGSLPMPVDEPTGPSYNFSQMKDLATNRKPSVILVDVREPSEYAVVHIPGSINVPYKSHPNGFALDASDFQSSFGIAKPTQDKELVFFCASGMRAAKARSVAFNNGFPNTAIYSGSMNDWVSNGGDKLSF
ncbi:similar to Saccharomyces cerevisiae YOR285W RDL1 Protein of unknown function containing a rhodanese-like domain [Maudiozyma barnettii]|uniref:Rhodanese domain-containing protein n=1 Tax=Maudiozyma barnettii TaxID=61262 RepID=A0A8H2VCW2_9SACH|nr:thiosulfate sulfurtransferase RDL1 [Kazachstania barnettii]CAB4252918.1 similar to Saccharomyces cerevisiae YOR285W RDL1 Protein of unknown function containing a rhodanese-like domain [Kazachstania barnettii]CAD1780713.1 similar to Saccharomyces cerevisiae YOR285W RDL1 Protein of unknown function containing a rhodanese-like domain [Kazachstania barnettii]